VASHYIVKEFHSGKTVFTHTTTDEGREELRKILAACERRPNAPPGVIRQSNGVSIKVYSGGKLCKMQSLYALGLKK
jgi:hypothetical protein